MLKLLTLLTGQVISLFMFPNSVITLCMHVLGLGTQAYCMYMFQGGVPEVCAEQPDSPELDA